MDDRSVGASRVAHLVEGGRPAGGDAVDGIRDNTLVEQNIDVWLIAHSMEQAEVLREFGKMLAQTSRDGGAKRRAGTKPSWKVDPSHLPAVFSHINKWFHGERSDADSGQHPFVHAAWRLLAIAWQETHGGRVCGPIVVKEEGR